MLINWFTVIAQIVNFLVLMALLKIFLYDRVVAAMDKREGKIADQLAEADEKKRQAEEREKKIAAEEKKLEENREDRLAEAKEAARSRRKELEEQARADVDALRNRWLEALDGQKESFADELCRSAAREVLAVSRRVISDMANEDFRDRLVNTFADRIREMDDDRKQALAANLDEDGPSAAIVSATEISEGRRSDITKLLQSEIHPEVAVDFRVDDELLEGVELRINGQKVAWSLSNYMETLQETILKKLTEAARQRKRSSTGEADNEENEGETKEAASHEAA